MIEALLFYLVFSPFFVGCVTPFFPKRGLGLIAAGFAFIQFLVVLLLTAELADVDTYTVIVPWVSQVQVNLSFLIDGLALFFALLVTGMGTLVFFYSNYYMDSEEKNIRSFYCYLNFFVGAMLGAIFSNNLVLLFLFWELTGIMSYMLISYNFMKAPVRVAARSAFLITAVTGLCLLLGIVLIGVIDQTLEISEIAVKGVATEAHPYWMYGIMVLLLIGVYGKSAQFPFHFWLPEAMVAPTPVSAYLHSATMVKLGIYLTARLYPLFIGSAIWFPFVTSFSLITILLGGFLALYAYSLKQILAYATICQLGFFMSFYGMSDPQGLEYDYFHLFNHALYKGSLFMLVGIIGHASGITDIRYIGGLAKKMPIVAGIFAISLAAMAGVPGTTGFLSKELVLRDIVLLNEEEPAGAFIFGALMLGLLFKVAFSFRLFYHIFFAKTMGSTSYERPSFILLVSPLILSGTALILGIWPQTLQTFLTAFHVETLHTSSAYTLAVWHGWSVEFMLSCGLLVGGVCLFLGINAWAPSERLSHSPSLAGWWSAFLDRLPAVSGQITLWVQSPKPHHHLLWVFGLLSASLFVLALNAPFVQSVTLSFAHSDAISLSLIASAVILFVSKTKMGRLISLSLIGFLIMLYYVVKGAPDLAITQMVIEVATLFIILLVFTVMRSDQNSPFTPLRFVVALFTGLVAASLPLYFNGSLFTDGLASFYLSESLPLGKGANAVNVILVDFRGLDTLGEVSVIAACALGVCGLLSYRGVLRKSLIPSPLFSALTPAICVATGVVGLYLLLRGHQSPGGGFSGGVISAIGIVLFSLARGTQLPRAVPITLTLVGLALAVGAGLPSFLWDEAYMTSLFVPGLSFFGTPLAFDGAIFILVVGAMSATIYRMRSTVYHGGS